MEVFCIAAFELPDSFLLISGKRLFIILSGDFSLKTVKGDRGLNRRKITIGICDDEEFFANKIKFSCENCLEKISDNFQFVMMHSGDEVMNYRGDVLDLLFLDIELGGVDGITVMQNILHSDYVWRIVFISTHEELVWDTFSVKTMGFVRKPIDEKEIEKYIRCALSELKKDVFIPFKKFEEDTYVRLSDLYFIEGHASYIEVHARGKRFVVTGKIGDWEEKLCDMPVIRVHKSFMVNLEHIRLKGAMIIISELNEEIPIGRKYKSDVQEKYTQFVLESMRNRN